MAVPDTRVYVYFQLAASGQSFFLLDDSVAGKLDSAYVLAGIVSEDVTDYVESVSISRGKSRQLEGYSGGQASVVLHNESRIFDPFNTASPYYGEIKPRKEIVIETNGVRVFSGVIDDWDITYDISGKAYAVISAIDGFLLLSSAALSVFTNTVQLSSDRINTILDKPEVAWPNANRSIDTGVTSLQADEVIQNQNALSYLQLIEKTENGQLFITKSGAIKFKSRGTNPREKELAIFSDNGLPESIEFTGVGIVYGSDNLYNRVTVTRLNGIEQTVESLESQQTYGIAEYSLDGLLLTTDAESEDFANYLLGLYENPELRIDELVIQLHDKSALQVNTLLDLELGDLIQVKFTPTGQGVEIQQYASVIKIENKIGIATFEMTLGLASIDGLPLILDDLIYGRLDLGYILSY